MSDRQAEDVRAEYAAIVSYFNVVDGFRFTVLGFYLAATGLIAGRGVTRADGLLLLGITVSLWLLEARNRAQLNNLAARGIQIEHEVWGYSGAQAHDAFFSRQYSPEAEGAPPPKPRERVHVWGRHLPFSASYSRGLDILFTVISAYSIYIAVRG